MQMIKTTKHHLTCNNSKTHRLFPTNASLVTVPVANVHQVCLCILTRSEKMPMWILRNFWWIITNNMQSVIEVSYQNLNLKSSRYLPWFWCFVLPCARHNFSVVRLKRSFRISNASCILTHEHSRRDCRANAKWEQCWTTTPVTRPVSKQTMRLFAAHQCHKRTMLNHNASYAASNQTNSAFICGTFTSLFVFLQLWRWGHHHLKRLTCKTNEGCGFDLQILAKGCPERPGLSFGTQIAGWEELTELSPRNSVRANKLTELGVWSRAQRDFYKTNSGPPRYPWHPETWQDSTFFLCPKLRQFLHIWGDFLTKIHRGPGEKETLKYPLGKTKKMQWRRRPEIADFCPCRGQTCPEILKQFSGQDLN